MMKTQTLKHILKVTLLIAVIAAAVVTLWSLVPVPADLATVSWNG